MAMSELRPFVGRWELAVDIPGAEDTRGQVVFEWLGALLVVRSEVPDSDVPDSICVIAPDDGSGYLQHYFDSRGVVRLYEMSLEDDVWTLLRTKPDFSPLACHQRYVGRFNDDATMIDGEWQSSQDGHDWQRDFGLVYRRI